MIGSVGTGATTILFDGHMDTVDVIDEDRWTYPPFSGQIAEGNIYGRGTVDMKGALAISIYAAAIARDLGLLGGRKVYVAGSVMEEDYDGVAVHNLLRDLSLRPDYVIFGEATGMEICRGHNGRALIEITVHGKAAHGSHPELGINPVYRQQAVVARIEALAAKLSATPGEHGTLSLTNVNCVTASNNSVPESSSIVLDRRLCITENRQTIEQEMAFLLTAWTQNGRSATSPASAGPASPCSCARICPRGRSRRTAVWSRRQKRPAGSFLISPMMPSSSSIRPTRSPRRASSAFRPSCLAPAIRTAMRMGPMNTAP